MSKTRYNHYVPQWYQEGFFEVGRNTLAYLDMKPPQRVLDGGRVITERALFDAPKSRAFRHLDLNSTFFGMSVNDEIERRLFGDIDARGSNAIRAFAGSDVSEWHRHFQTLFEYIDIQKIRTPKGLDWRKAQYHTLTQNELMFEMQGIRMMHCTIWSEGVREIVSAEDADVKFIISDHPVTIYNHAEPPEARAFGELIIEHPFLHAGTVKKEFSPVENPRAYRQEFLKTALFFLTVIPLVEAGLVNLIPDPCNFDVHLRDQMFQMARARSVGMDTDLRKEPRIKRLAEDDFKRSVMSLPRDALRSQLLRMSPGLNETELDETLGYVEQIKERDPLAVLQEGSLVGGEKGGQFNLLKLAPNFEIAMYLAQATGSCIVTDSIFRWTEIRKAAGKPYPGLASLACNVESSEFAFPQNVEDIAAFAFDKTFAAYPALIRDIFKYLANLSHRGPRPNREAQLISRFAKTHAPAQAAIRNAHVPAKAARISCLFPSRGIQDNTVNRLLLMSSSERHLASVPMAFFVEQFMAVSET